MGSYIALTDQDKREMLSEIGLSHMESLYSDVPEAVRNKATLHLKNGQSEMETEREIRALAARNHVFSTCLRGAGAYRHYIPAIVDEVASKEDFLTAYTPYQAEVSQGVLQSIFEYQTMICELTGLNVSNASLYDGASAAAEAVAMCRERGRMTALVCSGVNPDTVSTIKTYAHGANAQVVMVPARDGLADTEALESLLTRDVACFVVQQPNFYGIFEDVRALFSLARKNNIKCVEIVNPIALGVMETPADSGAHIAVGEGQPLGLPMAFGGPYLGFMACEAALMRKLPGRIVGETTDKDGNRAFVLTLQAREQHIRREKALSNVCSNEALCALRASVYLAAVGADGLKQSAVLCMSKAHYLADGLKKLGLQCMYPQPFFHEFLTACPVQPEKLLNALAKHDILGGLPVQGGILWCVTEMVTKEEMDKAVAIVGEVLSCG